MNSVTFVGNLTADPDLRFGASGKARASFRVAVNEGQGDEEKTHYLNVTTFGTLAENVADSLRRGNRVVVVGRVSSYSKAVTIAGEEKDISMISFTASAVGPDLRWATATPKKVSRRADDPSEAGEAVADAPQPERAASRNGSARAAAKTPEPEDEDEF